MAGVRIPGPVWTIVATLASALVLGGAVAGCGPDTGAPRASPTPSGGDPPHDAARAELAARAAAAQDRAAVSYYTFAPPERPERTIMVVRADDGSWRVDIPGGALGGTADVSIARTGGQLYHCAVAAPPAPTGPAGCVPVDELSEEVDPRVQHPFSSWLEVLTDRSAAIAVARAGAPDGVGGDCYAVQSSAASLVAPLDPGTYCYERDGTLTGAQLELGTLTLVKTEPAAPPSVQLTGPIVARDPLPLDSPPASPSPATTSPI